LKIARRFNAGDAHKFPSPKGTAEITGATKENSSRDSARCWNVVECSFAGRSLCEQPEHRYQSRRRRSTILPSGSLPTAPNNTPTSLAKSDCLKAAEQPRKLRDLFP